MLAIIPLYNKNGYYIFPDVNRCSRHISFTKPVDYLPKKERINDLRFDRIFRRDDL